MLLYIQIQIFQIFSNFFHSRHGFCRIFIIGLFIPDFYAVARTEDRDFLFKAGIFAKRSGNKDTACTVKFDFSGAAGKRRNDTSRVRTNNRR